MARLASHIGRAKAVEDEGEAEGEQSGPEEQKKDERDGAVRAVELFASFVALEAVSSEEPRASQVATKKKRVMRKRPEGRRGMTTVCMASVATRLQQSRPRRITNQCMKVGSPG